MGGGGEVMGGGCEVMGVVVLTSQIGSHHQTDRQGSRDTARQMMD